MKIKSFIISFLILTIIFYTGISFYYWLTDDFTIKNIKPALNIGLKEHLEPINSDLKEIFNQRFTYLGKGAQTYAFVSEDQLYVLKLVKQKHYNFSLFEEIFFFFPFTQDFKQRKLAKKQNKKQKFFESCLLCYKEIPNETALLYTHLKPTQKQLPEVQIADKLGFNYFIDLDEFEFIVQLKADLLLNILNDSLKENDKQKYILIYNDVKNLIKRCCEKGIRDRDVKLLENVGFVNKQAVFIDIGELYKDDSVKDMDKTNKEIALKLDPLDQWLEAHDISIIKMDLNGQN